MTEDEATKDIHPFVFIAHPFKFYAAMPTLIATAPVDHAFETFTQIDRPAEAQVLFGRPRATNAIGHERQPGRLVLDFKPQLVRSSIVSVNSLIEVPMPRPTL